MLRMVHAVVLRSEVEFHRVCVSLCVAKPSNTTCWTFVSVLIGSTRGQAWHSPGTVALRISLVL